jgi:hypothetical protein
VGEEMGAWPHPLLGALRDLDLIAGFLALAATLAALLRRG